MSSSVCFFVCVCVFFERERVVGARARATTLQQHREGEREAAGGWRGRGRGTQPSAGTDQQHAGQSQHKPVIFASLRGVPPNDVTEQNREREAKILDEREGESVEDDRCAVFPPLLASLHRSPLFHHPHPHSDKKTVRHGRSDCGLVEAVSCFRQRQCFDQSCKS